MTIEEKLEKAIEFIHSIEKMSLKKTSIIDIIDDANIYCEECGNNCEYHVFNENAQYVDASIVDNLKDKAWHILADLT